MSEPVSMGFHRRPPGVPSLGTTLEAVVGQLPSLVCKILLLVGYTHHSTVTRHRRPRDVLPEFGLACC